MTIHSTDLSDLLEESDDPSGYLKQVRETVGIVFDYSALGSACFLWPDGTVAEGDVDVLNSVDAALELAKKVGPTRPPDMRYEGGIWIAEYPTLIDSQWEFTGGHEKLAVAITVAVLRAKDGWE